MSVISTPRVIRCLITGMGPYYGCGNSFHNPSSVASQRLHGITLTCPPKGIKSAPVTGAEHTGTLPPPGDVHVQVTFVQLQCAYKTIKGFIPVLHQMEEFDCMLHVGLHHLKVESSLEPFANRLGYSQTLLDELGNTAPQVSDGYGLEGKGEIIKGSVDVDAAIKYLDRDLGFTATGEPDDIIYTCSYVFGLSLQCAEVMAKRKKAVEVNAGETKPVKPIPVLFCHIPPFKHAPGSENPDGPQGIYTEQETTEFLKGVAWYLGMQAAGLVAGAREE